MIFVKHFTSIFCYTTIMSFKNRLREEIDCQGLLVKELAQKIGISNSTLLSYIDAREVLPNIETGVKIAQALGVSAEYLVSGEDVRDEKKHFQIKRIVRDLKKLDEAELEIVGKMIHALI